MAVEHEGDPKPAAGPCVLEYPSGVQIQGVRTPAKVKSEYSTRGCPLPFQCMIDTRDIKDVAVTRLSSPRFDTENTHGTGCTLSSAIAAGLAKGMTLPDAAQVAKSYVTTAIAAADRILNSGNYALADTFAQNFRFDNFNSKENIFVVTSQQYEHIVAKQLPEMLHENILSEPSRKNTAPRPKRRRPPRALRRRPPRRAAPCIRI